MQSQRQEIEKAFHDEWAKSINVSQLLVKESFEAATAIENRYALSMLEPLSGKKLLDLGCGAGETSVYLALCGAEVTALDISPGMLEAAKNLAAAWKVEITTVESVAETLPFEDASFDLVFGNGVLHHTELDPTLKEIHRVLKPGCRAVFIEPLPYNPVIEAYRHLAKTVRTPTEKPFYFKDLKLMKSIFPEVSHREFWLLTLSVFLYFFFIEWQNPSKVRYWKKVIEDSDKIEWLFRPLKSVDDTLLRWFPWLGRMCWNTVLVMRK